MKKQTYIVGRMLYRREIRPDRHMGQSGPKRKSPHGSVQISRQVGRWSVKAHTHHKIFHYGPCHTRSRSNNREADGKLTHVKLVMMRLTEATSTHARTTDQHRRTLRATGSFCIQWRVPLLGRSIFAHPPLLNSTNGMALPHPFA